MSATSTDTPAHICGACGTVNDRAQARVATLEQMLDTLREDVGNLERELRSKRATISRMRAEQDRRVKESKHYTTAKGVLTYWRDRCSPGAKELGGKRLEHVIARLEAGYSDTDLKRCIDGYALKPYVVNRQRSHEGTREDWFADAELIFRDAQKVDQGIRIAERADDLRAALTPAQNTHTVGSGQVSSLGAKALAYARYGWPVFPCKPRDKVPATRNGLKDAKRDEQVIAKFWAEYPDCNVAIVTGKLSGLVVLDVDGEEGVESLRALERQYSPLPNTASIVTPRGGEHFYFRHPGWEVKNTAGYPGPGLDIRGDGGYVLAPPSVGAGGRRYEVDDDTGIVAAPEWLLSLLKRNQAQDTTGLGNGRDWAAFVRRGATSGQRNTRMTQYVGHLFNHDHRAGEVLELALLLNSKVTPPMSRREIEAIVKSISRSEARGS